MISDILNIFSYEHFVKKEMLLAFALFAMQYGIGAFVLPLN